MTAWTVPPIMWRLVAFVGLLVVIGAVFRSQAPAYLTSGNLHALFRHMAIQGVVAVGLTFVIVVRHFDMSLPGVASFGAMTLGFLISKDAGLPVCILGCAGIGLGCGLISGLAVGVLRLPDVVATIAMGSIAYGLSFIYNDGASFSDNFFSSGILDLNDRAYFSVDAPVFILGMIALGAAVVLHMTRFGQAFYATGENQTSARFSGIPVRGYVAAAFAICGALTCLAMVLHVASSGVANVSSGNQILMPAYAAVYLGAALFGAASVPATLAGALLMSALLNGFTLLTVPYYYSDAVVSAVLIMAIAVFDPRLLASLRPLVSLFPRKALQRSA
ncbi:ABC transporter permease [Bradyrhizobium sp. USDA 3458]|uniref:ABC transporter permease n=1 Tax=Bradyrhizobium sp. USDA 3458 TaxID=2591461 RepID=UPI001FEF7784|nr:ABC transporter permease [Bradyrhizobium sp. USDA 3458]